MACSFTEAHYREILRLFLDAGYRFTSFSKLEPSQSHQVVVRHDIDLSLDGALRMARIEAEMGVSSVYHLLVTAEAYNPLSAEGRKAARELRELGHAIGLHLDVTTIDGASGSPGIAGELSRIFGVARAALGPLDSFSWHRPVASGLLAGAAMAGLPFALPPDAHAFGASGACILRGDSRRIWRSGCICREIGDFGGRTVQVVIHPIWWTPTATSRRGAIEEYMKDQGAKVRGYLSRNLSFVSQSGDGLVIEPLDDEQ